MVHPVESSEKTIRHFSKDSRLWWVHFEVCTWLLQRQDRARVNVRKKMLGCARFTMKFAKAQKRHARAYCSVGLTGWRSCSSLGREMRRTRSFWQWPLPFQLKRSCNNAGNCIFLEIYRIPHYAYSYAVRKKNWFLRVHWSNYPNYEATCH